MGPLNHYTYQRKWTNLTGAPVFCLNYRKAPEHPFPQGLDDCWQVYNWLRDESHKYFKIAKEKEIILCGDSAGGNLSVALMNMLIDNDVKLPIYLLAIYPCNSLLKLSISNLPSPALHPLPPLQHVRQHALPIAHKSLFRRLHRIPLCGYPIQLLSLPTIHPRLIPAQIPTNDHIDRH